MTYIDYLDYRIFYGIDPSKLRSTELVCEITQKGKEDDIIFRETTSISRPLLLTRFKDTDVRAFLTQETLSRVKARISTLEFQKGENYHKQYRLEEGIQDAEAPDDDTIIRKLLSALLNIRKAMPVTYKNFDFEKEGFCNILGIDQGRFRFIKELLVEQGFIAESDSKSEFKENHMYITSKGYERLQTISKRTVTMKGDDNSDRFEYDVVISFAGEDREVAEQILSELQSRKITCFYDNDNDADLWGKDLYSHLAYIYGKAGKYCIMILSEHYARKLWTRHERIQAQARAFREKQEYILPIRLDETEIPGIAETIGYIDYSNTTPALIADKVLQKLSRLSK